MSTSSSARVLLAITGGVAAFKGVLLLRMLQRRGYDVRVLATQSALAFVGEATWHALSRRPVVTDLWDLSGTTAGEIHVELTRDADAMIIYPATTRVVGILAAGITDDVVTLTASCMTGPVVVCPAMHTAMANWPLHAQAKARLREAGMHVLEPVDGVLASGEVGFGRLPEPDAALEALEAALAPQDLAGRSVLVTAGPTREHVDPVRFLSNPSTGRMGFAVARIAARRGASVTLVAGPTTLATPPGVRRVDVVTAEQMAGAVHAHADVDVIVMTAAVADYRPAEVAPEKLKKDDGAPPAIVLERTEDILASLGAEGRRDRVLVGFAMETEDLVANARSKLERKGLHLVVANDLRTPGAGFGTTTNVVTLVDAQRATQLPTLSKEDVAGRIFDRVVDLLR